MRDPNVVVFGGSGFIGTQLVNRLSAEGVRVIVPTRRYERAKHLIHLPRVEVVELFTESLTGSEGGAPDYLAMMRENTQRIATGRSP